MLKPASRQAVNKSLLVNNEVRPLLVHLGLSGSKSQKSLDRVLERVVAASWIFGGIARRFWRINLWQKMG